MSDKLLKSKRQFIEHQIIGSALESPSVGLEVVDILTDSNFSNQICSRIFSIIHELAHSVNLDLVTICIKYQEKYKTNDAYQITKFLIWPTFSTSIKELCLILIEMDMRDKFSKLMRKRELESLKSKSIHKSQIWKQCAEHMEHPSNDIFESIDHLYAYLNSQLPEEIDDFNQLRNAIPKVVRRIKERKVTRKFIETLYSLPSIEFNTEVNQTLRILRDWTLLCVGGFPLPKDFHQSIHQLNADWNV